MKRSWTRSVVSLGIVSGALGMGAACGGGGDTSSNPPPATGGGTDAGHHDATTGAQDSGSQLDSGNGGQPDAGSGGDAGGNTGGGDASDAGSSGSTDGGADGDDGSTSAVQDAGADGATGNDAASDAGADTGSGNDAAADSGADATTGNDASADAGPDGTVGPDAAPDAADAGTTCDFNGTWGTEITLAVAWPGTVMLAPGSGVIRQWVLSTRVQDAGNAITDTANVCGVELPDFKGSGFAGGETYGMTFPTGIFDSADGGANLPSFTMSGTMSGSTIGSTYTSTETAVLIGLTLNSATTATWPTAANISQVDQDHDTKPGVTASAKQGSPYSDPPLDFLKTNRADNLYLAIRQVTSASASATSCDTVAGTVTVPQLGGAYAVDSHIIGCHVGSGPNAGSDCTTGFGAQSAFVDGARPVFTPPSDAGTSFPSTFTSKRLATGATCATVRSTFP